MKYIHKDARTHARTHALTYSPLRYFPLSDMESECDFRLRLRRSHRAASEIVCQPYSQCPPTSLPSRGIWVLPSTRKACPWVYPPRESSSPRRTLTWSSMATLASAATGRSRDTHSRDSASANLVMVSRTLWFILP